MSNPATFDRYRQVADEADAAFAAYVAASDERPRIETRVAQKRAAWQHASGRALSLVRELRVTRGELAAGYRANALGQLVGTDEEVSP